MTELTPDPGLERRRVASEGSKRRPRSRNVQGPFHAVPHRRGLRGALAQAAEVAPEPRAAPRAPALTAHLARARASLEDGAVVEAANHVETALEYADTTNDPAIHAEVLRAESLIAKVLLGRLGGLHARLFPAEVTSAHDPPLSPRTVFLLSRLDRGMTIEEALDVAGHAPHRDAATSGATSAVRRRLSHHRDIAQPRDRRHARGAAVALAFAVPVSAADERKEKPASAANEPKGAAQPLDVGPKGNPQSVAVD